MSANWEELLNSTGEDGDRIVGAPQPPELNQGPTRSVPGKPASQAPSPHTADPPAPASHLQRVLPSVTLLALALQILCFAPPALSTVCLPDKVTTSAAASASPRKTLNSPEQPHSCPTPGECLIKGNRGLNQ